MRRQLVLFIVIVSAVVAAVVATFLTQKPKLVAMSDEERRAFLGDRLGSRIPDEQIDKLAAAITARLDRAEEAPAGGSDGEGDASTSEEPSDES